MRELQRKIDTPSTAHSAEDHSRCHVAKPNNHAATSNSCPRAVASQITHDVAN